MKPRPLRYEDQIPILEEDKNGKCIGEEYIVTVESLELAYRWIIQQIKKHSSNVLSPGIARDIVTRGLEKVLIYDYRDKEGRV